jgi:hypothetical protein
VWGSQTEYDLIFIKVPGLTFFIFGIHRNRQCISKQNKKYKTHSHSSILLRWIYHLLLPDSILSKKNILLGIFSVIPLGEATQREGELKIMIFAWDMQL